MSDGVSSGSNLARRRPEAWPRRRREIGADAVSPPFPTPLLAGALGTAAGGRLGCAASGGSPSIRRRRRQSAAT
eukprot:2016813-Pyramimonas_sp.AAC.1